MATEKKERPYYTLIAKSMVTGFWGPQFGDYDRDVVEAEIETYRNDGFKASEIKIVKTARALQQDIDAKIDELNAKLRSAQ